ncbi:hypothetical protein J7E88_32240 [Streptomyces sp. ISL-10]|nr:hypothetical protein [Streptomyces sp. ISL-10]
MLDQNSAVSPRRSSPVSFFAHFGSARTCWSSSVMLPMFLSRAPGSGTDVWAGSLANTVPATLWAA